MTGVVFMISSALFRNEVEAQTASRGQSHQMTNITRSPGICFHSCLGTPVLAYTQKKKKKKPV